MSGSDAQGGRDIRDHLVYRMSLYTTIADRNCKAFVQQHFGVSLREFRLLSVIAYAQPVTLMKIVEECCLDKGQVSRTVSKLVSDGFARRLVAEGRAAIGLTDKGRAMVDEGLAFGDSLNGSSNSVLTEEEQEMFSRCLDRLIDHARAAHEDAHDRPEEG